MDRKDLDVGSGLVGAPACGDVMKLQIRVDKDTNTISGTPPPSSYMYNLDIVNDI